MLSGEEAARALRRSKLALLAAGLVGGFALGWTLARRFAKGPAPLVSSSSAAPRTTGPSLAYSAAQEAQRGAS